MAGLKVIFFIWMEKQAWLEMCLQKPDPLVKLHIDRTKSAWQFCSALSLSFGLMQAFEGLILDRVVLSSNLRHYEDLPPR